MAKIKVSELQGKPLVWVSALVLVGSDSFSEEEAKRWADYAAKCVGVAYFNLEQLIERYHVGLLPPDGHRGGRWTAFSYVPTQYDLSVNDAMTHVHSGGTPLTAVLRSIVSSTYDVDEVEVPDELLEDIK